MRRDYGLKQRVSMIITIELSEDDIIDLRALEGLLLVWDIQQGGH
jgi:hypothetical protein